jgi:hypothetical protein
VVAAQVEVDREKGVAGEDGLDCVEAAVGAAAVELADLISVDLGDLVAEQVGVAKEEVGAATEQSGALLALELGVFDQAEPGLPECGLGGAVAVGKASSSPARAAARAAAADSGHWEGRESRRKSRSWARIALRV